MNKKSMLFLLVLLLFANLFVSFGDFSNESKWIVTYQYAEEIPDDAPDPEYDVA